MEEVDSADKEAMVVKGVMVADLVIKDLADKGVMVVDLVIKDLAAKGVMVADMVIKDLVAKDLAAKDLVADLVADLVDQEDLVASVAKEIKVVVLAHHICRVF